jgi:transporter family protein|uniref:EamA domain-containing protein n=1 Tax=Desulfobacca acetoxidans TaxID=60893 RepID=A0A7C3SMN4_9BACT
MPAWLAFSLMALTFWGIWGVLTKVATLYLPPYVAYLVSILGYLPILGFLLVERGLSLPWHPVGWSVSLAAGVSAALGLLCYYRALAGGAAAKVVPLTAMYPVVTVLLSYMFMKEHLTVRHLVGLSAALVAVWLLSE